MNPESPVAPENVPDAETVELTAFTLLLLEFWGAEPTEAEYAKARKHWDGYTELAREGHRKEARTLLAAILPAIRTDERAKVAEELRADADAHRRIVAKKPSQYDEARLARAKTLDDAAARITRGGVCEHWWEVRSLTGPPAPYGPCTKCGTPHPGGQA